MSSFPRKREPRAITALDSHLRGDDELISAGYARVAKTIRGRSPRYQTIAMRIKGATAVCPS